MACTRLGRSRGTVSPRGPGVGAARAAAMAGNGNGRRCAERSWLFDRGLAPARGAAAQPMKIAYVAASPIPSGVASSVHVVKMCQGMARLGHEVVLLAPQRPEVRGDVADIFAFYGVDACFEIRRVSWPPA